MAESMLTTEDNPYNPFIQFDEWLAFDEGSGYNTLSYLARIANTSPDLSDEDNSEAIEDAINEIIDFNLTGNYVKVSRDNFEESEENVTLEN